eukprot:3830928-Pyramimonas_sp.AAC.1
MRTLVEWQNQASASASALITGWPSFSRFEIGPDDDEVCDAKELLVVLARRMHGVAADDRSPPNW